MSGNLGNKVAANLSWKFAERMCAQIVSFVVTTVLARILLPEDYGTIAMVNVFITFADLFVTSGLGTSLIQKKNADETDFSSMFYFGVVYSGLVYLILFFLAPMIARFYSDELLSVVIRVMGLRLPIACVNSIQHAYVSKHLIFKKFFFSTLFGTMLSAVVGIVMALNGYGVWALVAQYMTNSIVDTVVLFITVPWHPRLRFSISRVKELYSYGWKLLANALLHNMYIQFKNLVVGKVYTAADLAYLNRGEQLPSLIITNINTSIESVILPVLSEKQNEPERIKAMVKRSTKMSVFIIWPLMMGLFVLADSVIVLLFTDKWEAAVPYLRINCIVQALVPLSSTYQQVTLAMGRSDLVFKIGIPKKIGSLLLVLLAARYSVKAIAYVMLIQSFIDVILNILPNIKLINYKYGEICKDLIPYLFLSVIMGAFIFPISWMHFGFLIRLLLQVVIGIAVYIVLAYVLKINELYFVYDFIKGKIGRLKQR